MHSQLPDKLLRRETKKVPAPYSEPSDNKDRNPSSGYASTAWKSMFLLFIACSIFLVVVSFLSSRPETHAFYLALTAIVIAAAYLALPQYEAHTRVLFDTNRDRPTNVIQSAKFNAKVKERELFRSIFDNAAGMAIVKLDGTSVKVNRSLCEALGYCEEDLSDNLVQKLTHPDDVGPLLFQMNKILEGGISSSQSEQRFQHKHGHDVWMLVNISLVRSSDADPHCFLLQFQDITDRKREEERLVHDVFHDALTGLPNRTLFMDRLKLAAERARRHKNQVFGVLFIDLDGFKTINDRLGHLSGDQLLIEVGRRLRGCLRTTDTIARLGGDEFTIVLEDFSDQAELIRIIERLQQELARPFELGPRDIMISASIGVAISTRRYEHVEEILREADMAMYKAKSAGKKCYYLFDGHESASTSDQPDLDFDLAKMVERNQLFLHYQPIVSLENGKLLAFEALVRWQHPQRGVLSPMDFVRLAEKTGTIMNMGMWVLREACLQLKRWQAQFPYHSSLGISVNLSSKQFVQPEFNDRVIEILNDIGLDPRRLQLEITETVVMENIDTAAITLHQLQALGVDLGIDDFGTGYSSLSYLHRLPINSLKLDKSFVRGMVKKREHAAIVRTILALARSLGIRVIAEGVETLDQLIELRRLQCDAAQGFLFAKPLDAEAAGQLLGLRNQWHRTITTLDSKATEKLRETETTAATRPIALLKAV